jgi:chromosome segregation ATPase
MNIPTVEQARSAGEMIDRLRSDLIAATERSAKLEASITEMEAEHRDAFEDMKNANATEVEYLRSNLKQAERLITYLDDRLNVAERNNVLEAQAREGVLTALDECQRSVDRCVERYRTRVQDAIERERDQDSVERPAVEFEPVQSASDPGVTIRRIDPEEFMRRLTEELGREPANPHDFPEDNGQPVPKFLRRAPTISPGQQGDPQ